MEVLRPRETVFSQTTEEGGIVSAGMYRKVRAAAFSLISILLGLAVPLLMLEITLRFLPVMSSTGTMAVDQRNPVLRFTPNQSFTYSKGWRFDIVNTGRINNYGFVNDQDYTRWDEQGPIVIVGDSYVEALMVPYQQTVQGRLTERLKNKLSVYSIGISGSQLSQYLAFAEYAEKEFHPRAIVFIIIGNDFDESFPKYKNGPGFHYFEEERNGHDLTLVRHDYHPSLVKRSLRQSALVRYLWGTVGIGELTSMLSDRFHRGIRYVGNTDAGVSEERLADSRRVVGQFFLELPQRLDLGKTRVMFVVDAIRPEIYSDDDLKRATGSYFDLMRRYFLEEAQRQGYETIDMQPRFLTRYRQDGSRFEFAIDGHWNGLGHQEAAEAIASSHMLQSITSN